MIPDRFLQNLQPPEMLPHNEVRVSVLTVVETVYFFGTGDAPISIDNRYSRSLSSDEQPYLRRLTLTEDWTPLDVGWLKDLYGSISLRNEEGLHLVAVPSKEEIIAISRRVVELSFSFLGPFPDILLLPGATLRLQPARLPMLRTRSVPTKVTLAVFPR